MAWKRRLTYGMVILAGGVAVLAAWFYGGGALGSECEDSLGETVASPDGELLATVFERDCGATTDHSTQVALRERGSRFAAEGEGTVFVVEGRQELGLRWLTDRRLEIRNVSGRVFRAESSWGDVDLVFQRGRAGETGDGS